MRGARTERQYVTHLLFVFPFGRFHTIECALDFLEVRGTFWHLENWTGGFVSNFNRICPGRPLWIEPNGQPSSAESLMAPKKRAGTVLGEAQETVRQKIFVDDIF